MLVLKIKGIKKQFSKDPIDFQRIRKDDVKKPKGRFFRQKGIGQFKIADSDITEIKLPESTNKLLIFIHGGAFISGPAQHHWDTIQTIAKETNQVIWLCDYPKAPENNIKTITEKETPNQMILISPVMDASMSNPEIQKIEATDPMLGKAGVLSAKRMCAAKLDLNSEIISPLYGSFKGLPRTSMFAGEHDIMYPDQVLAIEKMKKAGTELNVTIGKEMPHIWPMLPVMEEGKEALEEIVNILQ